MDDFKIPGDPLLGFGDFFADVSLGAAPKKPAPRHAAPKKPAGKPAPKPSKGVWKQGKWNGKNAHADALHSTAKAGQKAIALGKKLAASAAKYQAEAKSGKHAPIVPLKPAKVRVNGTVVLGIAPKAARVLTLPQRKAVAKHAAAVAKHQALARAETKWAKKAQASGQAALNFAKSTAALLKTKMGKGAKGVVAIHGAIGIGAEEAEALLGLADSELLEILGYDANGLAPGEEGYDPSTETEGATPTDFGESTPGYDPTTGIVTAPDGSVLYDPANDPDVKPVPARGGTLSPEDAKAVWQNVPEDGVPYAGGWSDRDKGSWGFFYGPPNPHGDTLGGAAGMIWGGGDGYWHAPFQSPSTRWIRRYGQQGGPNVAEFFAQGAIPFAGGIMQAMNILGQGNDNWDDGFANDAAAWAQSQKDNQGPLIGNPKNPAVAGLQYAVADNKWFWQSVNAPAAACAEIDNKIREANQKTIDANTTAARAQALQMANDAAAKAEAQAKAEADQLLAQTKADTAAITAQSQADVTATTAQATADAAAMQQDTFASSLDLQQQQMEIEAAKQEAATQAQAQQAMIAQTQIWNEWAKAHPEEAVAQMREEMGPADEGEYAEESYVDEGGGEADAGDESFDEATDEGDTE